MNKCVFYVSSLTNEKENVISHLSKASTAYFSQANRNLQRNVRDAASARCFRRLCFFDAVGVLRPRPLLLLALQPLLLLLQVRCHVVKTLLLQVLEARARSQRRWQENRKWEEFKTRFTRTAAVRPRSGDIKGNLPVCVCVCGDSPSSVSQCFLKTSVTLVSSLWSGLICTNITTSEQN